MPKKPNDKVCCLCECNPPQLHECLWECPIFSNFQICSECCTIETLYENAESLFSKKLGRIITREEMSSFCGPCGRNYNTIDPTLADKMRHNSFHNIIESKQDQEIV